MAVALVNGIVVLLGAGAGSFFGLKGALNGMRKDVSIVKECARDIHTDVLILKDRMPRE